MLILSPCSCAFCRGSKPLCAIAREQAHAQFDSVGSGYYQQAFAAQSYCAAYVAAKKFVLDVSAFRFDKVCQSCAGMDAREKRGFLSDVKRGAYAVARDIQRSFREQDQTIRPDEFAVGEPKPEKPPKIKPEKTQEER